MTPQDDDNFVLPPEEEDQARTGERPEKCGYVAVIGAPNAGKSTLTNTLVGQKVAIVTHKVQTTRSRITAIALQDETQIIFLDTPGIFKPKGRLDRAMVDAAWSGAEDADVVALLVDAVKGLNEEVSDIISSLENSGQKAVLVLNKVDLLKKDKLLVLATQLNERFAFEDTFMISAETGSGVDDFKTYLADRMPVGMWLYPEDQLADISERLLAAEVTREKLFLRCHQELPYAATVETESFKEQQDGSLRLEQVIFVQRESQRRIVLGKGGQQIKAIGQLAREEMQDILGSKVHLFLFVKVRDNWKEDPERYREMGLDFKPGKK